MSIPNQVTFLLKKSQTKCSCFARKASAARDQPCILKCNNDSFNMFTPLKQYLAYAYSKASILAIIFFLPKLT